MSTKHILVRPGLLVVMLLSLNIFCSWAGTPENIKKKEINKSFNVSKSDLLLVDNRYGNITITHGNKNEVAIQVLIEVKADNESVAQSYLDRIQVEIDKTGNTVSAITSLKEQNNNGNNIRFTINYYIRIPSTLPIDLSQKYGNINLPDKHEGRSNLNVKYGNIHAGSFTDVLNLEAKYGNVTLNNVAHANLDLGYCGNVSINNGSTLNIDSKYSNMEIKNIHSINLENKYGNMKIESVSIANLGIKYSQTTIGNLKESLSVSELSYSTLTVKEVSANFTKINADARYGNLNLHIPANASFNVSAADMKYGNYDIKGFNITRSSVEEKVNHRSEINGGGNRSIHFEGNNYSNLQIKAL